MDVVISQSRLTRMSAERRQVLREYLQDSEIVGKRVSEIRRTIKRRWGWDEISSRKLIRALEDAVRYDCGPREHYDPKTGSFTKVRETPAIKCPVSKCKCQGSIGWHRKLAR